MSTESMSAEPHALHRLFCPQSVALIGASEKSAWSHIIYNNFAQYGFEGKLFAVNKRGAEAHGLPGFATCRALPDPVDSAYFFAPAEGMIDAVADAGEAGIKYGVVLTSGFAEAGEQGAMLQQELVKVARRFGMSLLGPNSLGFANFSARTAITAVPPPRRPMLRGHVGLISQSGAAISDIAAFGLRSNIGFSFMAALGNEAMLGVADLMDYLIHDEATRSIAIFAEGIRDTAAFARAAVKAASVGKPVVIMKVGRSALTAKVAASHTGSIVGDDRVFDEACARFGVMRTDSIESLITTAGIAAHLGRLTRPGVGVLSISGGACGMIADQADAHGVSLPVFAPDTTSRLQEVAAAYGTVMNPMDITGAAVRDPNLWEQELAIMGNDPALGVVLAQMGLPETADSAASPDALAAIGRGFARMAVPGILLTQAIAPVTDHMRSVMRSTNIPLVAVGIENTVRALGKLGWWSKRVGQVTPLETGEDTDSGAAPPRPITEREVLDYLAGRGVSTIPAKIVPSAEEAAQAAGSWSDATVLKVLSPDIQHKTEVGGVALNLQSPEAVANAFDAMSAAVRGARPDARIEGFIVSPMRSPGLEMLVGTMCDPQWGPVIVVGMGGVWVEVLKDTALRLLPVTRSEALDMVRSLKSVRLLEGYRGQPAIDMDALVDTIVAIGDAALALGDGLESLEVNPLRVGERGVEALDGVAVWKETHRKA